MKTETEIILEALRQVVFVRDTATEKEWMILRIGEQSFILSDSNLSRISA